MTVKIELEPDLDSHVRALAEAKGMSVEQYLRGLIQQAVENRSGESAVALLDRWASEDATEDSEEIARRDRDWDTLREALNRSHSSDRVLFP